MACCTMAWPWLRQRLLLCHQVQWTTFSPPDALGTMTMSSAGVHYFNFSFLDSLAGLTSNHSSNVGFLQGPSFLLLTLFYPVCLTYSQVYKRCL